MGGSNRYGGQNDRLHRAERMGEGKSGGRADREAGREGGREKGRAGLPAVMLPSISSL